MLSSYDDIAKFCTGDIKFYYIYVKNTYLLYIFLYVYFITYKLHILVADIQTFIKPSKFISFASFHYLSSGRKVRSYVFGEQLIFRKKNIVYIQKVAQKEEINNTEEELSIQENIKRRIISLC
jgi:hypothetical protein